MGENCGKQDAFRDGVLSGTGRRWGRGSVQTVIVPLFALSEIRSQTRQNWGYTRTLRLDLTSIVFVQNFRFLVCSWHLFRWNHPSSLVL